MKHHLLAALSLASLIAPPAMAQGVLSAPGAPAPTMKTLAQIEPRSPAWHPWAARHEHHHDFRSGFLCAHGPHHGHRW